MGGSEKNHLKKKKSKSSDRRKNHDVKKYEDDKELRMSASERERLLKEAKRYVADRERESYEEDERANYEKDRRGDRKRKEKERKSTRRRSDVSNSLNRHHRRDGHHHESKRKRKYESSDNSDDSNRRRDSHRHRKKESRERKERKSGKGRDGEEKHSKRHRRNEKKEHSLSHFDLGPVRRDKPANELNPSNDYFQYHNHLRLFIYLTKGGISFEDLTSEETHRYFKSFCSLYNGGKLEEVYYLPELPNELLNEVKRTNHSWNFRTSETERKTLTMVREGVKKQTEWSEKKSSRTPMELNLPGTQCRVIEQKKSLKRKEDNEEERLRQKIRKKMANKQLKDRVKVVQEELGFGEKKYGREREIELKREQSFKQHAAFKQKESDTVGPEISDRDIYGGGDDFKAALNKEKMLKAKFREKKAARIQELQAKEEERRKNMLQHLGLSHIEPGNKITIAPRNDS
mmetsp:Transcript_8014/g.10249  ORF Transcript_8014/g.10249 Transcript_8014/m.10249 type:complete len:460 (-) Transcript_8014:28-1407(-)